MNDGRQKPNIGAGAASDSESLPASDRLPGVGERFGGIQFEFDDRSVGPKIWFTVEEGSVLVSPPLLVSEIKDSLGPTMAAILRIDGNVEKVAGAYARQAREYYPDGEDAERWRLETFDVIEQVLFCGGGCGAYQSVAVERSSGSSYLMLIASTRT